MEPVKRLGALGIVILTATTNAICHRSGNVVAGVLAFVMLNSAQLLAQSSSAPVKPGATRTTTRTFVPPKTPWGDPDLQGTWTSDAALGIPLQRPAQFAERAELDDKEFSDKVAQNERTRKQAENAVGSFRGDGAWLTRAFRQTGKRRSSSNLPTVRFRRWTNYGIWWFRLDIPETRR